MGIDVISVIVFIIISMIVCVIAYFLPLKIDKKIKLSWCCIAIFCSFLFLVIKPFVSFGGSVLMSTLIGIGAVFLLSKKERPKELETASKEMYEKVRNNEENQESETIKPTLIESEDTHLNVNPIT